MQLIVDLYRDGVRVDAREYHVYAGRGRSQTVKLDVTELVRRAIATAIGEPDSIPEPKKELDTHDRVS